MPPKKTKNATTKPKNMSTNREDDFQNDVETDLGKCAKTQKERRATLEEALLLWSDEDICRLWRVDDGGRCGWAMMRW